MGADSLSRWRSWPGRLLRIAAYALIGLFLLKLDPFGFGAATGRYSERVFYNVFAPQYGAQFTGAQLPSGAVPGAAKKWNEKISVILLDDQALGENDKSGVAEEDGGVSWPVPMAYHVKLLTHLYETYTPSVIMVDLVFRDVRRGDRPAIDAFASLLQRIEKEKKTKIFLASSMADRNKSGILKALSKNSQLAVITWPKAGDMNPLYYPLAKGAGISERTPSLNGTNRGAAYEMYAQMYAHLCNPPKGAPFSPLKCPRLYPDDQSYRQPMQIFWGMRPPDINWEQAGQGVVCADRDTGIFARGWKFLKVQFAGKVEELYQTCPYHPVFKARDFMDPEYPRYEFMKTAWKNILSVGADGRPSAVFYGASLFGAEDFADTPTHGDIPGVFVHAMALDNLLTMGANYIRELDGFSARLLTVELFVALLIATVAIWTRDYYVKLIETRRSRLLAKSVPFAGGFLAAVAILVSMVVSFLWFRIAPVNWVGLFGILGVMSLAQLRGVEAKIETLLNRIGRRR